MLQPKHFYKFKPRENEFFAIVSQESHIYGLPLSDRTLKLSNTVIKQHAQKQKPFFTMYEPPVSGLIISHKDACWHLISWSYIILPEAIRKVWISLKSVYHSAFSYLQVNRTFTFKSFSSPFFPPLVVDQSEQTIAIQAPVYMVAVLIQWIFWLFWART